MITPRGGVAPGAVSEHYDSLDRWYQSIWGEHVHHGLWLRGDEAPELAAVQLADRVGDLAGISSGTRFADAGCGYGATLRRLQRERGATGTGYTLSPAQAAQAADLDVRVGDWLANDLPGGSCGAVIAIESVSHMPDVGEAFAQAARVLRPGGRLVVCDWLARERRSAWRDSALLEPICREGRLPAMRTAAEYGALMADAGLRVEAFSDESRRVSRTWTICLRRTLQVLARDPSARAFLLSAENPDRIFALTMLRILAAYGTRAMVYGTFAAVRAP